MTPMPEFVRHARVTLCATCPTPCGKVDPMNPCTECPLTPRRFGPYTINCEATAGLGDVVAAVAQPLAKAIDRVFKTNIANCGGCKKRQAALNALTS